MTTATDLFAGSGGSTEGLTRAGIRVVIAANHWDVALGSHQDNHPDTEHRIANLSEMDWRTFPTTDLLWASPSCVWHARAGGRSDPIVFPSELAWPTAAGWLGRRGHRTGSPDRRRASEWACLKPRWKS